MMKLYDQTSSLFWLLVSVAVFLESIRLGVGSLHNPGRGFLTFGASGILGILALILFIQASLRKPEAEREPLFAGKMWKRIVFVLTVLWLYAWVMPTVGYLISTFILMLLLFWVLEKKKIGWVFASSVLSTLLTYVVFSKWLNCQFPDGLLGF
jgi:putative tricarboxylic transport membrane protein